jgi:prepilin-type N-terminal cleavage/methylation domain-containing protein
MKTVQRAFTLLEILVVISIIGILIALGAASYTTAQKTGRDARRKADIKSIQEGFEQFYASNASQYPTSASEAWSDNTIFPAGELRDPRNSDTYVYTVNTDANGYCVCALLESAAGNAAAPGSGATTCSYASDGDYYCLSNLQ